MAFSLSRHIGSCYAVLLLSLWAGEARAQQELRYLHVLIVADTQASGGIGPSCKKDAETMEGTLRAGIPANRCKIEVFQDQKVNRNNILAYLANLNSGPNDAILFYYAGHGEIRMQPKKDHHLTLSSKQDISRTELRHVMQTRKPGLAVILTDCCSNGGDRGRRSPVKPQIPTKRESPIQKPEPGFQQLFFRSRGLVDITAADDGYSAYGDNTHGGVFTAAFSKTLRFTSGDDTLAWTTFYQKLKVKTEEEPSARKYDQGDSQTSRSFSLPGMSWGFLLYADKNMLKVSEIHLAGAAEQAGLQPGDVLVRVNGKQVSTGSDWRDAVGKADRIQVTIRRGEQQFVRMLQRSGF